MAKKKHIFQGVWEDVLQIKGFISVIQNLISIILIGSLNLIIFGAKLVLFIPILLWAIVTREKVIHAINWLGTGYVDHLIEIRK